MSARAAYCVASPRYKYDTLFRSTWQIHILGIPLSLFSRYNNNNNQVIIGTKADSSKSTASPQAGLSKVKINEILIEKTIDSLESSSAAAKMAIQMSKVHQIAVPGPKGYIK